MSGEVTFEEGSVWGRVLIAVMKSLATNQWGEGYLDNLIGTCRRANLKGYSRDVDNRSLYFVSHHPRTGMLDFDQLGERT